MKGFKFEKSQGGAKVHGGPKHMNDQSSFFDYMGYKKNKDEKGYVTIVLNVNEDVLTAEKTIPAGVFASMLDGVIGSTFGTEIDQPTTESIL
ncbi:hypothetical protein MUO14_06505 [Halobacillus shinanisalinarum]|uniref:Uncharacterized protein n=1 Tax=Halobacillus shinanisalinarum TaxID=2932258 RepID=A0ABY4H2D3_9BACI|nr:hypothetical protein [Halobacillus shinanisalinarum]UOQ94598.1 hypothetical protein MUO14_06505 [Halobacillus shinanisalinarum]